MLACWWRSYNQGHIITTLLQFFVYQHAAWDIDIYFPEWLLFTGQGLKEQGSWKSVQMEAEDTPWMCFDGSKSLRLTRHPFQSLRKFGAKSEFLTHQATLSCYPCVQKSNTEFTFLLKQHYKFPEKTNRENIIISLTNNHKLIKDFLESLTWLLTGTEPFPRSRTICTSTYMANLLTRMITAW